ncbi:MAG: glutaredoxin 3 [Candidatus Binatota bacterium]|jgi:glutaredoxin 3|nr:glutaredoxin 3 [Candidatus Binatota bacterium]
MAEGIILYTKTGCPYCAAKRRDLTEKKVAFTEINVSERPQVIPELLKLTRGERVVPVIVDGAEVSIAPEGG